MLKTLTLGRASLTAGALVLTLALAGCAAPNTQLQAKNSPEKVCQAGDLMAKTTLYYGLTRYQGKKVVDITKAQWENYVDKEVTPRFRDGLTIFNAQGQWLGKDGQVTKEPSRALMVIYPANDKASSEKIQELRQIYMKRFNQESVMRVDSTKCVSF
ncbi:DUF3574 domain-containing protein [Celerinatantimonas yamalensis]|uniref:DUF3574 domain-containing protein n=1 Tax=Celerinatantimonas yamalensis TaxID=559956 RepID=A0ABW9G8G1_9GAMM